MTLSLLLLVELPSVLWVDRVVVDPGGVAVWEGLRVDLHPARYVRVQRDARQVQKVAVPEHSRSNWLVYRRNRTGSSGGCT